MFHYQVGVEEHVGVSKCAHRRHNRPSMARYRVTTSNCSRTACRRRRTEPHRSVPHLPPVAPSPLGLSASGTLRTPQSPIARPKGTDVTRADERSRAAHPSRRRPDQDGSSPSDRHLLTNDCLHRGLERIDRARERAFPARPYQRAQVWVRAEERVDRHGVCVEIKQAPDAPTAGAKSRQSASRNWAWTQPSPSDTETTPCPRGRSSARV